MIGYTLADRYEILEKIGSGGMGNIYKVYDKRLDRIVALKVLKIEYSEDESFVRKFRKESLAAASTSHPNIISIYDVGSEILEGQIYCYIVMEYIDDKTLKEVIREGGPLPVKRTFHFALRIAETLEVAHSKHIVHRDIKSQNIIVTRDYRVKVTDFGIARIIGNSTVIMTDSVIGSIHYSSPEQARGSGIDTRSDIYSLGIILFETLTEDVPFDGKNSISAALVHIRDRTPLPSDTNPNVDVAVGGIIRRVTMKNPKEEIQKVEDVIQILRDYPLSPRAQQKEVSWMKRGQTQPLSRTEILQAQSQVDDKSRPTRRPNESKRDPERRNRRKSDLLGTFLEVLVAVLISVGIIFGGYKCLTRDKSTGPVLKDYINQPVAEVQERVETMGLLFEISEQRKSNDVSARTVLEQSPSKRTHMNKGDTIYVVASAASSKVIVPSVNGHSYDEARALLEKSDLTIGSMDYQFDKDIPEKMVVGTDPQAGTSVRNGSLLALIVSKGEDDETVVIPDLRGNSVELTRKCLEEVGLKLGGIDEKSDDSVDIGEVIRQSYEVGTKVSKGTAVNLITRRDKDDSNSREKSENNKLRNFKLNVNIPTGDQSHNLTVQRKSEDGGETIVDRMVESGQVSDLKLRGKTGDVFEVYVNENVINSYTVGQ